MIRSRLVRLLLVLAAVAVGYHRLGMASCAIGLVVFLMYELFAPPPRYRVFGPDQAQQAIDHRMGRFGGTYCDVAPPEEARSKVSRNDPCPCGSGLKFKRCCGR